MILRRDPVEEFAAAAVLDDHAKLLLVQVAVVQPADVRVVDAAHRPDLDRELRDRPRVGVAQVDDLDRADVASVRARERDKNGAEAPLAQLPSNHVVALDGLQPEVVRGMRREKFEPTQAVVDGRAADGPRQLRGHRCRTRRLSQCSRVVERHPFQAWPATRVHRRVLLSLAPRHRAGFARAMDARKGARR